MDCQMPEMDGYQATGAIRECEDLQALSRTPIVAMTANVMAGDRERCMRAGMDDYIGKPLRVNELERVLSRWIQPSGPVNEAVPAGPEAVEP
jgi:CheY-like chemotaxis protein